MLSAKNILYQGRLSHSTEKKENVVSVRSRCSFCCQFYFYVRRRSAIKRNQTKKMDPQARPSIFGSGHNLVGGPAPDDYAKLESKRELRRTREAEEAKA